MSDLRVEVHRSVAERLGEQEERVVLGAGNRFPTCEPPEGEELEGELGVERARATAVHGYLREVEQNAEGE